MAETQDPEQSGSPPGLGSGGRLNIPNHRLLRLIARGSYGEVWLAKSDLGTFRAVKVVFESTFRDKRPFERELAGVQRFEPVSRLHEGLMDILQVGRNLAGGYFYYIVELADDVGHGQSIPADASEYVARTLARDIAGHKRLPVETCIELGLGVASALSFLHSKGLIHRDVKPSNIVFVNGVPKLADIGLVAELTEARSYVGTEGFIPPEGPGTVQADLYSLGKLLYELSTGKDRHDYPELPTLLDKTIHGTELVELNRVIIKACRTDPGDRYRTADELIADLQRLKRGERVPLHRFSARQLVKGAPLAGMAVLLVLLLALFGRLIHPVSPPVAAGRSQVEAVVPVAGLVSYWPAERDARDLLRTNPGELMNKTSFAKGKVGQAFSLNGFDQFVLVPDSPALNPTNGVTMAAWVFPGRLPTWVPGDDGQEIIGKDGTVSNRQFLLSVDARHVFAAHVAVDKKGYLQLYGGTPVVSNTWYHIAMTYDQKALKLYVNGTLDASRAWSGPIMTSPEPFRIGGGSQPGVPQFHFSGRIDEVYLYNRALSETEIQALYKAGNTGKRPVIRKARH